MEFALEFEKPIALLDKRIAELRELHALKSGDFSKEIEALEEKLQQLIDQTYSGLSPWQRVQLSRHPNRPYALDYIGLLFDDFMEIHGDRAFGDDPALVAGFAKLDGRPVAVIAQQKGRNTKQKIERNFGMVRPEGYRKAIRMMRLASKFSLPLLTFIDTPGAYPGIDAEERGQSEAIARSMYEMLGVEAPAIATVIGEGGSGGALAIGIADIVLVQEYATYAVISPESCASILWSDSSFHERAATIMKMTATDLESLEVVDGVVKEPRGGAHRDFDAAASLLKKKISAELAKLDGTVEKAGVDGLLKKRFRKFREMGKSAFTEK